VPNHNDKQRGLRSLVLKRADADFSAKQAKTVFIVFLAIVIAGALLFLNMYGRYNDRVLYEERLSQMGEVTTEIGRAHV